MEKTENKIPHLAEQGDKTVLMVNGEPFIMLAGEVHNSNSSSVAYMEQVWEKAEKLGMNTLLLPVSWELIEPQEGVFDFHLVDGLIEQARRWGGKLGFLWFGSWKNAQCYYAPEWVKADTKRFRRAEVVRGKNFCQLEQFYGMPYTSLSYLCKETMEADARAFAALMAHIRDVDGEEHTVLTVQVENETGLMGSARERSKEADARFAEAVPEAFAAYMRANTDLMVPEMKNAVEQGAASGSWAEVFGDAAEEVFSAYHVADYVNAVAKAGKEAYPLPMTVNCWLDKGGAPGSYPTGGPVSKVLEVWRYRAPEIDIFAPDIYIREFIDICDEMTRRYRNPLYIPECATHSYAGPRAVYCVGHYHAMCYAPFGFEEMGEEFSDVQAYLFGVDTEDPALKVPQSVEEYGWYNRTMQSMLPLLTSRYGTDGLQAVCGERKEEDTMLFGTFGFRILTDLPMIRRKDSVCLIVRESEDTFYILANACMAAFFSQDREKPYAEIFSCEEGEFGDGVWKAGRRLNGDEAASLKFEKPRLVKIRLHAFD